jgi:hypothetical protein
MDVDFPVPVVPSNSITSLPFISSDELSILET